jgi:hypothetical protein
VSRTRMIKPAFFKHAELYEAERETGLPLRLAFAGLWTVADREGRFRWKIDVKTDVLPYDPVDILAVLAALERFDFVRSYVVDGKKFGFIPAFKQHQSFHHTERQSMLPGPPLPKDDAGDAPATSPISNRESPVRSPADTVTTTGTGTVTGTEGVVVDKGAGETSADVADVADVPAAIAVNITEPALTSMYLAIWANGAVAERWGERRNTYTAAQAEDLAHALREAGVEWEIAKASIYDQARRGKMRESPGSPAYFGPGILKSWQGEVQRRANLASGERAPPRASPNTNGRHNSPNSPTARSTSTPSASSPYGDRFKT